jgi:predicted DNA-binding protein YlxM (UPF0122 family)
MTFGSLFTGIGGIDLGLERAGMICQWQVENDKECIKDLERHWPEVKRYGDIKNCFGTVDLLESIHTPSPVLAWEQRMRGKLRKLTEDNVCEAMKLYQSGLSLAKVADYFSVSRQALWDLLRRRGLRMRSQLRYGTENHFHRGGKTASDRAQNLLEEAVEKGIVKRGRICETCKTIPPTFKNGRTGIQAHHSDYNKPLDVMWLCQKCHHEWHQKNRATPLEVKRELAPVNMLAGGFP